MPRTEWSGMLRRAKFPGELGVFPTDVIAIEGMRRIGREGTQALIATRTPRNILQHRLIWALADKLTDCVDTLDDREQAMFLLKVKAKHGSWVMDPQSGELHFKVDSISFDALAQEEFDVLFERFVKIICQEIVPGLSSEDLKREVLDLAGGELGRRAARGGRGEPDPPRKERA